MAYRSPSPNPSRAQSPRPKTPEPTTNTRKYPAANPSPSSMIHRSMPDLPQRNSSTKGLREASDQKENERGSNGSLLKRSSSPATPSSKGTKNFMSPTLSAMSKVISSSSKKRILGEINDAAVRSSLNLISDSDMSDMFEEVEPKKTDLGSVVVPVELRNSSDRMRLEETILESDRGSCNLTASDSFKFKKSDPELKAPQSSAPCSTDLSPYDLQKNYLSPRPQFLHYKPNPRIELYRNRKEELFGHGYEKQLEDSSSVESCEEDSVMTDETENDGDDALASGLEEEDECEKHVIESKPCCKPTHCSSRSFYRPRLIPLVLMLVAASLFIPTIDTPMASSSHFLSMHQPFRKLYAPSGSLFKDPNQGSFLSRVVAKFARVYDKAEVLQYWSSANHLAYDPIEHIGTFQVINSTVVIEEEGNAEHNQVEQGQGSGWDYISMDYLEDPAVKEAGVEDSDEKEQDILEKIEAIKQMEGSEEDNHQLSSLSTRDQDEAKAMVEEYMQPELVFHHTTETELVDEENSEAEEAADLGSSLQIQHSSSFLNNDEHEIADSAQKDEVAEEDTFSEGMQFQEDTYQGASSHESGSKEVFQGSTNQVLSIFKLSVGTLIGASSVVISLATVLLSLYLKKTQPTPDPHDISPSLLKKVTSSIPDGISQGCMPDQSPLYRSYPMDAQTMVESCGPEMSSTYHNTASNNQIWRKGDGNEDEILSYDRTIRRDSTASSTSYGSFTTYERLSGRKGSKDEALTPVRRSSRIRSQVTSP